MKNEILIIIGVVVFLLILIIAIRNSFVVKRKKIERNKSLIDVFLKKRFDLIPNLVEVCKGYSKYEQGTLENITKLRASFKENPNESDEKALNTEYKKLIAVVEKYPELKASANYLKLQKEMVNVQNEIQASRRIYINSITDYNNLVMTFPSSIIAMMFGFHEMSLPEFEYDDVKINFN